MPPDDGILYLSWNMLHIKVTAYINVPQNLVANDCFHNLTLRIQFIKGCLLKQEEEGGHD